MDHWTDEARAQVIDELCRRTAVDAEFRALALNDPAAAIAKVTTRRLPSDIKYRFVETAAAVTADNNAGTVKTIVLPDSMPETEELSDLELEKVAGGNWTAAVGWNR